ncbi:MAG TPA: hypothetical protein P5234_15825 [Thermoanaerobaculaceae bacterium]|nr:hypothetical protein [Phycisphaerales bacterium]HRS17705.1 hypothetical protein [Thermoanaerobaculaceae bacterium]
MSGAQYGDGGSWKAPEKVLACYGCGREIVGDQVLHLPALAKEGIHNVVCPACHIDMNRTNVFRLVHRCVVEAVAPKRAAELAECDRLLAVAEKAANIVDVESSRDPWRHRSAGMRCRTCMWFVAKELAPGPHPEGAWNVGRCRRHAPAMGGYPVVKRDDWCGDHRLDENKA